MKVAIDTQAAHDPTIDIIRAFAGTCFDANDGSIIVSAEDVDNVIKDNPNYMGINDVKIIYQRMLDEDLMYILLHP